LFDVIIIKRNIVMKVISNKIVAIFVSLIIVLTGLTYLVCPQKLFSQSIEDELEEVKQQREDTQKKIEEGFLSFC